MLKPDPVTLLNLEIVLDVPSSSSPSDDFRGNLRIRHIKIRRKHATISPAFRLFASDDAERLLIPLSGKAYPRRPRDDPGPDSPFVLPPDDQVSHAILGAVQRKTRVRVCFRRTTFLECQNELPPVFAADRHHGAAGVECVADDANRQPRESLADLVRETPERNDLAVLLAFLRLVLPHGLGPHGKRHAVRGYELGLELIAHLPRLADSSGPYGLLLRPVHGKAVVAAELRAFERLVVKKMRDEVEVGALDPVRPPVLEQITDRFRAGSAQRRAFRPGRKVLPREPQDALGVVARVPVAVHLVPGALAQQEPDQRSPTDGLGGIQAATPPARVVNEAELRVEDGADAREKGRQEAVSLIFVRRLRRLATAAPAFLTVVS